VMFTGWYDRTKRPVTQVSGPITTAQVEWELMALVDIYEKLAPNNVLEIGSQSGGTLWYWIKLARAGTHIMNIDILQNQTPGRWQSWADEHGMTLKTIIARSDEPDTLYQVKRFLPLIDFLFIDALHTYEGAKNDFLTYGPLVRQGGVIAFHDLKTPQYQQHIQIGRLWREIQGAGYKTQELRTDDRLGWGGIGVVYV